MKKKEIEKLIYDLLEIEFKSTSYTLVDVEFVKEGQMKYLRVYVDKTGGITLDDCSEISTLLSSKLDELDPIDEHYLLEVSSPGIDRPFKSEEDYLKNINQKVEVKLYKSINGEKYYEGLLLEKSNDHIIVDCDENKIKIDMSNISKINKAVLF